MRIDMTGILLILTLGTAIALDLRWRKIPNWLTGCAVVAGLGLHTSRNQITGFLFSLEGAVLGLALFLVMYVSGWIGAGDVKLYAAVGSFLGPAQTCSAAIIVMLVGGLFALVVLALHQGWRSTGLWLWSHVQAMALMQSVQLPTSAQAREPQVPYAVAIGVGTTLSYWWYPLG